MDFVTFRYINHRGEESLRRVQPIRIYFGTCRPWHEGFPQWLMVGWDRDKQAERTFAMKDITDWRPLL